MNKMIALLLVGSLMVAGSMATLSNPTATITEVTKNPDGSLKCTISFEGSLFYYGNYWKYISFVALAGEPTRCMACEPCSYTAKCTLLNGSCPQSG